MFRKIYGLTCAALGPVLVEPLDDIEMARVCRIINGVSGASLALGVELDKELQVAGACCPIHLWRADDVERF